MLNNINKIRCNLLIWGLLLTPHIFAVSLPNDQLQVHLNFENENQLELNLYSDINGINPEIIDQVENLPSISRNAVSFDDVYDYLLIPQPFKSVKKTEQMTIGFWMNLRTMPIKGIEVIGGTEKSKSGTISYAVSPTGKSLFYLNTKKIYFPSLITSNEWTHIALTYDSTANDIKLYMNGKLQVTDEFTGSASTVNVNQDLYLGRGRYPSGSIFFDGSLDDVKIYDQVLSEEQIKLLSTHSVYVSETANKDDSSNKGTKDQPFHSIQYAIDYAEQHNIYNVRVAEGTYYETLKLSQGNTDSGVYRRNNLHLQGGHKLNTWETNGNNSVVKPSSVAETTVLVVRGWQMGNIVEGFDFIANDASGLLSSSIAVRLDAIDGDITFLDNNIVAGNGSNGANGVHGTNGGNGQPGGNADNLFLAAIGGAGCHRGGGSDENVAQFRAALGTGGQASNDVGGVLKNGELVDWQANNGGNGGAGGCGSGGNGGAASFCIVNLAFPLLIPGGGGGGGGWGGWGGGGGQGGGGSIGIIIQGKGAVFFGNTIATSFGGNGGNGGGGGSGGSTGAGGLGITCWNGVRVDGSRSNAGGLGGQGAGGNGGNNIGLMSIGGGQFDWDYSQNVITLGMPGTGGIAPSVGIDGIAQEIADCYIDNASYLVCN